MFFTRPEKNLSFYRPSTFFPRPSTFYPRPSTFSPRLSKKATLDYSVENVHCTISTMSCHGTQQNMHRPLKLVSFVFPMKISGIITTYIGETNQISLRACLHGGGGPLGGWGNPPVHIMSHFDLITFT